METVSVGKYCYNMALKRVQYSSDTSKCSPNNVRRLFISSDGVLVQYFVSADGGLFKSGVFNPAKVVDCFCDKGFVPIIKCLSDLICSNVEEIVFCTGSQCGIALSQKELNLSAILEGYSGSLSPDLIKSLLGRFVRLRSITFFNGMLTEVAGLRQKLRNYDCLFSDLTEVKSRVVVKLTDNTQWYTKRRLRPQHYMLDIDGGKLSTYFLKVEETKSVADKSAKIAELKNERLGSRVEKIKDLDKVCTSFYKCIMKSAGLVERSGFKKIHMPMADLKGRILRSCSTLTVPKLALEGMVSTYTYECLSAGSISDSVTDEAEKYELLAQALRVLAESLYTDYFAWFFNGVRQDFDEMSLTTKLAFAEFPAHRVFKPANVSSAISLLEQDIGISLEGTSKDIKYSVAVISTWLIRFHVMSTAEDVRRYRTISYWESLLNTNKQEG